MKEIKIHNKLDKPDNIVYKEQLVIENAQAIEKDLPGFMRPFFLYIKNSVLPLSRLSYLFDIRFFCQYLINETSLTEATQTKDITKAEFNQITAPDVNLFIGDYCVRYKINRNNVTYIYENGNRSLSRKKSSLSVLFKTLYREGVIEKNITDAFNPVKLPKPGEREIKRLDIDEIKLLIDAVSTGNGLTDKEKTYWEKTKRRDKAIILMFITYGLRLYELQQLNISSFNFNRGEFKIYRKRGKEAEMPLNKSIEKVIHEYIHQERPHSDKLATYDQDALFLSLQNKRITERAIRDLVKKYTSIVMNTTKKQGYSPHKLRATAATALIEQDHSIFDVQNLLDHDNITTTQLYAAHKKHAKRELIRQSEWLDEFEPKDSNSEKKPDKE